MASSCSSVVMRCMGPSGALKTVATFRARIADRKRQDFRRVPAQKRTGGTAMAVARAGTPPFRAEVIGSLLRPRRLKDAGRAVQEGRLPPAEYQAVLEAEIARVVARQEDIGLAVVTDGELARSSWFGFFFEALGGFRLEPSHFKFRDADGCAFEWPTCVAEARIPRRAPLTIPQFARP